MPRSVLTLFCFAIFLPPICLHGEPASQVQLGLRLPPGFEVTEFADSKLANDIHSLAVDPRGRVVVSGRGYIRILVDDDDNGQADRAIDFADEPKDGAQGLLWEATSLLVTGDGGLRRYRDDNGDDRADGPSELIRAMKTGGEHDAHDIKRGPDGWLYVLCGNSTGLDERLQPLPTSPIARPVAGCVLRFPPDLRGCEVVAEGFRNAYRMDFNADGELFTYDSDNERCVSLPWYEGTRFYHVIPGGHHGWLSPQQAQWWRMPPYFFDVVAPVADLGRGSPTGLVCYRHPQFPVAYRGGFFLLDWTFGKVHFIAPKPSGATYTGQPEVFLESVGDNGFAPTDAVVHPVTGDLYLAIGGRGTRGAVYRVRHAAGWRALRNAEPRRLSVRQGTWNWHPERPSDLSAQLASGNPRDRLAGLFYARRYRSEVGDQALEAGIKANWDHADRYLRKATADLLASLPPSRCQELSASAENPRSSITCLLALARQEPNRAVPALLTALADKQLAAEDRLAFLRVLQRALEAGATTEAKGTIWEGYTLKKPAADHARSAIGGRLQDWFPSGQSDVDRETSRTLAMLESTDPNFPGKLMDQVGPDSALVEDIHYLTVLARCRGPRQAALTRRVATALLDLDRKVSRHRLNRDRHWPMRISELYAELAGTDPKLHAVMLRHPEFGRPDHALFALAPGFDRRGAAEVFLDRAARDPAYDWNATLVEIVGSLPVERSGPLLRQLWDRGGLEDAIRTVLAHKPEPMDRQKFLDGLQSPQAATIRLSLEALGKLPDRAEGPDLLALVRALRSLGDSREEKLLADRLGRYLQRLTGRKDQGSDKAAWTSWFSQAFPELANRLGGTDGVDLASWGRRLAALDWAAGDAERGRTAYTRANCGSCHSGAQALGPDLRGAANRFSRDDLFTAMLQPSRDISPRYRTTMIETADGQVYQGMIVYEAVDSVILQTGPTATIRLAHKQIASRRATQTSLMPAGLLDKLTDRDLADLYAYLKSLR